MHILKTVFITVVMIVNILLLISMYAGSKKITGRSARLGLSFLFGCIILDMMCILGGAVW